MSDFLHFRLPLSFRGFHIYVFDSVPAHSLSIFLRCVHISMTATAIENMMNDTEVSPYRRYMLPENIVTNSGKQHPAVIDASDT